MANGFKALRHVGGGVSRLTEYPIASELAENIFNGDMVFLNSGNLEPAVTNEAHIGSFLGVMFVNSQGEQKFSPAWVSGTAGTEIKALVNADANTSYKVADTASSALSVGDPCDLVSTAGNLKLGKSNFSVGDNTNTDFTVLSVLDSETINGVTTRFVEVKLA